MARGKRSAAKKTTNDTGARLGFEQKLWAAADKLRGHMDPSEYKHVVLGLIFLKYISDAFQERYEELTGLPPEEHADPEDRDEYTAGKALWNRSAVLHQEA
jgi:type I restriction enzyme M protein